MKQKKGLSKLKQTKTQRLWTTALQTIFLAVLIGLLAVFLGLARSLGTRFNGPG